MKYSPKFQSLNDQNRSMMKIVINLPTNPY